MFNTLLILMLSLFSIANAQAAVFSGSQPPVGESNIKVQEIESLQGSQGKVTFPPKAGLNNITTDQTAKAIEDSGVPVVPSNYFGAHFFYTAADLRWSGVKPTEIPDSITAWRLWDAYGIEWRYLQPQRGKWDFKYLDRYVAQAQSRNIELTLTLGQTPEWASARPKELTTTGYGNAAEPADIKYWRDYVRTVVSRYKGKIANYEIWNEPAFSETDKGIGIGKKAGYFSGSAKTMTELTKEAYQIIKEVDPNARVISPSIVGQYHGVERLRAFLQAGGGNYVDIIGFHFYFVDSFEPEKLPDLVRRVRDVMTEYQIEYKPIWNTESGLVIQSPGRIVQALEPGGKGVLSYVFNDDQAAGLLSRYLILGWVSGLERYYWFAWDSGSMGLLRSGNSPRKINNAGKSFEKTKKWLENKVVESCAEVDSIWRCSVRDVIKKRSAEIIWSTLGEKNIIVSSSYKAYESLLAPDNVVNSGLISGKVKINESPILVKPNIDQW